MNSSVDTTAAAADPAETLPVRDRHPWALFTDWCTAFGHEVLPADPLTVAQFVRAHPAAAATQRRRLSVINTVHTRAGLPPPGRSETVRQLLDAARRDRFREIAALVANRVPSIPTTGWPQGLFGRRDRLLLVLAAGGLGFVQSSRLRRGDVHCTGDTVSVDTGDGHPVELTQVVAGVDAVAVYRDWAEVQSFLDEHPNTRLLAQHLTESDESFGTVVPDRRRIWPLLTPIDRWGHTPLMPLAMTAQSVAAVVRAHLIGRVPVHRPLPIRVQLDEDGRDASFTQDVTLDPDYYERGVAARHAAQQRLGDIAEVFDEIGHRADALLEELLTLLDDVSGEPGRVDLPVK
ncbi:hypothetical protein G6038_09865 [Rhodococcus sp. 14C212]|uniref:hypothetical protein n=1 Tax=Rhodococcus sp. 14C212 TaxID=2711209 RepID=UPI0013EBBAA1|nr:hypothetical protein [Rhodococcus sp. 14C212]NGP05779.1 hypothetical protein [Rhodococcus sp. 14C212]